MGTGEGNDGMMTTTDDPIATAEAGMVETGEHSGYHDSGSDDSSKEDEDMTLDEPQELTRESSISERRSSISERRSSSTFFTAWMERRVGNGWTKKSSSERSCNEMTTKTAKSSAELSVAAADSTAGFGGLLESSASFTSLAGTRGAV